MGNNASYLKTPRSCFGRHKSSAKVRGIAFEFTFEQWWGLWREHWNERGKLPNQYCMSRKLDKGPYALGNVEIKRVRDNRAEQPQARGSAIGISKLKENDIPKIKQMLRIGVSQRAIAAKYQVCQATIKDINVGNTWKAY